MATIRDVAKKAGVAPITVSRVINNSGYISTETRARVEAAIAELDYVPNRLSQSLRFKKTNTLAFIVTDIANPFWPIVARGVEDACSEFGLNVILCNTDEKLERQNKHAHVLLQRQVDGFLLVPYGDDPQTIHMIQRQGVPIVVLDRQIPEAEVDVVRSDSEDGAYQLTQYLIQLGHRRIAMLAGPRNISTSRQRVMGYRRALEEARIPIIGALVHYGEYNQENGHIMTPRMLAMNPAPSAFFGGNNLIAIGILKALHELGLRAPEDISVVSFDDLPGGLLIKPFLTAVTQSGYEMGYQSAQLLIAQITGEEKAGNRDIVLPVELQIRESCRAISETR